MKYSEKFISTAIYNSKNKAITITFFTSFQGDSDLLSETEKVVGFSFNRSRPFS